MLHNCTFCNLLSSVLTVPVRYVSFSMHVCDVNPRASPKRVRKVQTKTL